MRKIIWIHCAVSIDLEFKTYNMREHHIVPLCMSVTILLRPAYCVSEHASM
jgi:hypothetical protein